MEQKYLQKHLHKNQKISDEMLQKSLQKHKTRNIRKYRKRCNNKSLPWDLLILQKKYRKYQKNIWETQTISAECFLMEDVLSILISDRMEVMYVIFSETKNTKAYHQMYLFLCNKL